MLKKPLIFANFLEHIHSWWIYNQNWRIPPALFYYSVLLTEFALYSLLVLSGLHFCMSGSPLWIAPSGGYVSNSKDGKVDSCNFPVWLVLHFCDKSEPYNVRNHINALILNLHGSLQWILPEFVQMESYYIKCSTIKIILLDINSYACQHAKLRKLTKLFQISWLQPKIAERVTKDLKFFQFTPLKSQFHPLYHLSNRVASGRE